MNSIPRRPTPCLKIPLWQIVRASTAAPVFFPPEVIQWDPKKENLGRQFLYARYNADLIREGLDEMGFKDIKPERVQKLDSISYIGDLRRIGRKVAEEIKIEHFGNFIS